MAIGSDYTRPIIVNGFQCRNCDDVSNAKRNIDPTLGTANINTWGRNSSAAAGDQSYTLGGILSLRVANVAAGSAVPTIGRSIDRFA